MGEQAPEPPEARPPAAPPRPRISALWAHARAVLVTAHLAAIVIAAIPGPDGGMSREVWRDPTVQSEIAGWSARLRTTPERLEAWVFPVAMALFNARNAARRPVAPYVEWTGVEQPWRLFVAPDRVPSRFELSTRRGAWDAWEVLFEERSNTARWRAWYFEHPRVRRALYWYGWPPVGAQNAAHCAWVARAVFDERADAAEVRCRFYRAPSPSPAEARSGRVPAGTWGQQALVARPPPSAPPASSGPAS